MQTFRAKSTQKSIDFARFMIFWAKSNQNQVDFARNCIMILAWANSPFRKTPAVGLLCLGFSDCSST